MEIFSHFSLCFSFLEKRRRQRRRRRGGGGFSYFFSSTKNTRVWCVVNSSVSFWCVIGLVAEDESRKPDAATYWNQMPLPAGHIILHPAFTAILLMLLLALKITSTITSSRSMNLKNHHLSYPPWASMFCISSIVEMDPPSVFRCRSYHIKSRASNKE